MTFRPLPPGPVEHDDDGNPIPQPAENSDARDLIQLLEYGRMKGFDFSGAIRVGKIAIQRVRDLRQREGRPDKDAPDDVGIWEEHGYKPEGGE